MKIKIGNLFKEEKPSLLKDLFKEPDDYIYTLEVIDDEIVIRARKKDEEENERWKEYLYLCNSILNRNNCWNEHDERT